MSLFWQEKGPATPNNAATTHPERSHDTPWSRSVAPRRPEDAPRRYNRLQVLSEPSLQALKGCLERSQAPSEPSGALKRSQALPEPFLDPRRSHALAGAPKTLQARQGGPQRCQAPPYALNGWPTDRPDPRVIKRVVVNNLDGLGGAPAGAGRASTSRAPPS